MNKVLSIGLGLIASAVVTVGVLFLIRQVAPLARIAGIAPAKSLNPINEAAA